MKASKIEIGVLYVAKVGKPKDAYPVLPLLTAGNGYYWCAVGRRRVTECWRYFDGVERVHSRSFLGYLEEEDASVVYRFFAPSVTIDFDFFESVIKIAEK